MEQMLKIAVLGVVGTLAAVVIKKNTKEFGVLLTLAVGAVILWFAMTAAATVKDFIIELTAAANVSPAVLNPVIKTVGVAVITKISSDICRDAGESAIAGYIEIAGAAIAIYLSIPLMSAVLKMINSIM